MQYSHTTTGTVVLHECYSVRHMVCMAKDEEKSYTTGYKGGQRQN